MANFSIKTEELRFSWANIGFFKANFFNPIETKSSLIITLRPMQQLFKTVILKLKSEILRTISLYNFQDISEKFFDNKNHYLITGKRFPEFKYVIKFDESTGVVEVRLQNNVQFDEKLVLVLRQEFHRFFE